jgi:spore germination protein GerM
MTENKKLKHLFLIVGGIVTLLVVTLFILTATGVLNSPFSGIFNQEQTQDNSSDAQSDEQDQNDNKQNQDNTSKAPYVIESEKGVQITINSPKDKSNVNCNFDVEGEVAGTWYFEGDFPVKITNMQDKELATGIATAQGEWMTEEKVEFNARLNCDKCKQGKAKLVFNKSNPSGKKTDSDSAVLEIQFNKECSTTENTDNSSNDQTGDDSGDNTPNEMTVNVFYPNTDKDPQMLDCTKVYSVTRTIPETRAVGRAALENLLAGPTQLEKKQGYITQIPDGVKINSLSIENGVARVDFNNKLQEQVGGSCRVNGIRSQIEETLKQFPTVDSVIISIEGETDLILQP